MGKRHSKSAKTTKYCDRTTALSLSSVEKSPPVHDDHVTCVDSGGPGICISGSADKTVVQYNWLESKIRNKWIGHDRDISRVIYGDRNGYVISGSRDKSVCIWQSGNSKPVKRLQGHDMVVMGLALNQENTVLCTGSRDNYIKLWDIETGTCTLQNNLSRNLVTHIKWIPNQDSVAQTSEDKCLRTWDTRILQESHVFAKKQYIQTCCDVSDDGNYCVTSSNGFGGQGCEATLWDLRQNKGICEYKGHSQTTASCIFLPSMPSVSKTLIATSSHDCSVKIWDQNTTECLCTLALDGAGPLTSLTAYGDGSTLPAHTDCITAHIATSDGIGINYRTGSMHGICCASFNTGVHLLSVNEDANGIITLIKKAQY